MKVFSYLFHLFVSLFATAQARFTPRSGTIYNQANPTTPRVMNFRTTQEADVAVIYMYDVVGEPDWMGNGDDTQSKSFITALAEANASGLPIQLRINSRGGDMHHGMGIQNAIRRNPVPIEGFNDGECSSMAFGIWLACDKRHMPATAVAMAHNASTWAWGDAEDFRNTADQLDAHDVTVRTLLVERTNLTEAEVNERFLNGKDNYLTAQDCLDLGLIDEIETYATKTLPTENKRSNVLQRIANFLSPDAPQNEPAPKETPTQNDDMTTEQIKALALSLGLSPDATADDVHNAAATKAAEIEAAKAAEADPMTRVANMMETISTRLAALEAKEAAPAQPAPDNTAARKVLDAATTTNTPTGSKVARMAELIGNADGFKRKPQRTTK